MSDPLASLRSKLANQPHVVTSKANPTNDPLAAIRAKVKGGKASTAAAAPLSSDARLTRLEKAVKELLGVATTDRARAQLKQFS
jgi:hypothetical protein